MIVYRFGAPGKYVYKDSKDHVITDKVIIEYITKLVIPPAYKDVEIDCSKNAKILFQGYDQANRLQQIYSAHWNKKAYKKKFASLIAFGKSLPKIFMDINKNIKSPRITKNKIISLVIKLISHCYFRIGNYKYYVLYESHGTSTLKKKHLHFTPGGLDIEFIGKKSMINKCTLTDKEFINELKQITSGISPDEFIFTYPLGGKPELITAIDINNWLKKYNPDFTTKMFRTFDTNTLLIDFLNNIHKHELPNLITENHRKKNIVIALKEVSQCINNTAAICKKNYANVDIIRMYIENPKKYTSIFMNDNISRINFIKFLQTN